MERDELDKKYYRIADVAEIVGVNLSTLRFWEKEFSELRPKRTGTRTRLYTPRDLELLELIKFLLKERGLKIEAARNYIRHNRADLDRRHQVIRRLQGVRSRLQELLSAIDARPKQ